MIKKLLLNGTVLTMDGDWQPEELDIIVNGQIIEGIKKLNKEEIEEYINDGYQSIDMSNKILMPGLINTHGHAGMTLLRGYGEDLPLQEWLQDRIWPFEDELTDDDIYWGSKLAIVEMIESGTTTFADMYFAMDRVAQAVEETGIRACLSRGLVGLGPNGEAALAESEVFINKWHNQAEGRVTCTLGPHAPYTCPLDYLEKVIKLSEKIDCPLQIHVSETMGEVDDTIKEHGISQVELLEKIGLFSRPTLAAHCVHLNDKDMDILKKYNVRVAHNPSSNLKLASGVAPIQKYLDKGITVGIGTDSCASNNNLDMFEEMKLAALLQKGINLDASHMPAKKVLEMVTIDGAKALFIDNHTGSLKVGKQADIIAIDINNTRFYPKNDILAHLIYSMNSSDISDSFIAGQWIMNNRKLNFNKEEIISKAENIACRIKETLNTKNK